MGKLRKKNVQPQDEQTQSEPKASKGFFGWRSKSRGDSSSNDRSVSLSVNPSFQPATDAAPTKRAPVGAPKRVVAIGGFGETEDMARVARMLDDSAEPNEDQEALALHAARAAEQAQVKRAPRIDFPVEQSNSQDPNLLSDLHLALARLPVEVWTIIADHLRPVDAANLAFASKLLRYRLGASPWDRLADPTQSHDRLAFLKPMDVSLPTHLLCIPCLTYHHRTSPSTERLYGSYIAHPPFTCPNALHKPLPKHRLTSGRDLPYYLVQLALRAHRFSPTYGLPLSALARSWRCAESTWTHRSRFHIHAATGHLLMRITSSTFAPAALTPSEQRLLLFSRAEYTPYYSVCAHWHSGDLIPLTKCALSHIPEPRGVGIKEQMRQNPGKTPSWALRTPNLRARQCDECKSLRRCPRCPTEYVVEIKMVEDPKDKVTRFKHALCVTRWSDLGDGRAPSLSAEWNAINGIGEEEFDSFGAVGNATLCSHFEGAVSNGAPNQRARSLGGGAWMGADVY